VSDDLFELDADDRVVLRLHVQPGAGRAAVAGRHGGALKVKVASPPASARANEACLALVAAILGVDAGGVTLVGGESSRTKRVAVSGVEAPDARRLIETALAGGSGAGPMPDVHTLGGR
jgi:uncharacterized protein